MTTKTKNPNTGTDIENNNTMTIEPSTQTQTQTTQATTRKVVFEHPNGTSHRLVAYNHDGWNPQQDLSLLDYVQVKAGISAIGKWVANEVAGSPKLVITAPVQKLMYENGTGTFGYVRNDFVAGQDDRVVEVDGVDMLLTVDQKYVPDVRGYRRLHLDGSVLLVNKWEPTFTSKDEDPWQYWYCRTLSCLLAGGNVSVSVKSQDFIARCEAIMAVVNSDDPAAANEQRRYNDRVQSRFGKSVRDEAETIAQETQGEVTVSAEDLVVPLKNGGTINLAQWPVHKLITLVTEGGITFRPQPVKTDEVSLLAMAKRIRTENLKVIIHQQ